MTSREMVQDSATRNQRTLADAVVATNRFRELDARFKSRAHDSQDHGDAHGSEKGRIRPA